MSGETMVMPGYLLKSIKTTSIESLVRRRRALMKVNRSVEMNAEDRYLQSVKSYKLGIEEYRQGIPIDEPPFYLEGQKIEGWMMGWRSEEYLDNAGKSRHS